MLALGSHVSISISGLSIQYTTKIVIWSMRMLTGYYGPYQRLGYSDDLAMHWQHHDDMIPFPVSFSNINPTCHLNYNCPPSLRFSSIVYLSFVPLLALASIMLNIPTLSIAKTLEVDAEMRPDAT